MEEETVNCSSGWYVLYCDEHDYVCHKSCRGKNEGWHSNEYGCDMIYTMSGDCAYCGHHWNFHSFRSSYKEKVPKKKTITEKKFIKNEAKKKRNEEKEETKKLLLVEIGKGKAEVENLNKEIYADLMNGINILYQLALKNNELNQKALQTDDNDDKNSGKYGYARRLLRENTEMKKDSKVYDFFESSLNDIEDICSTDDKKERKVIDFQKSLLEEDVE